ncbi:hypothetical protein PYCC9005_000500 [Savitreella phatthalungensis]
MLGRTTTRATQCVHTRSPRSLLYQQSTRSVSLFERVTSLITRRKQADTPTPSPTPSPSSTPTTEVNKEGEARTTLDLSSATAVGSRGASGGVRSGRVIGFEVGAVPREPLFDDVLTKGEHASENTLALELREAAAQLDLNPDADRNALRLDLAKRIYSTTGRRAADTDLYGGTSCVDAVSRFLVREKRKDAELAGVVGVVERLRAEATQIPLPPNVHLHPRNARAPAFAEKPRA